MNFDDSPAEARFRAEARAFLEANAPAIARRPDDPPESETERVQRAKAWQKIKYEAGWACIDWPEAYGGRGASPMEQIIWQQEESRYDLPTGVFLIGHGMAAPTIMALGTEEQKQIHLQPMARGDVVWCQLFSEPAGGSDLANLRTRAERDGDEWVVNGQKIWTSGAHYSDWAILVTRTDPTVPKHKGLTFFLVDMGTPGIDPHPIKQITGAADFNEVYLEDVRIPDSQRVGAVGDGWRVAMTVLMNERVAAGGAGGPGVEALIDLARRVRIDDRPAIEHGGVREKIAEWYCLESGLEFTNYRVQSALSRGDVPGPENSISKIVSANRLQALSSFALDLMELGGIIDDPVRDAFLEGYLFAPGIRIAGGTDEILRNIIAERVLGLPGDIRVDKNVPFSEVPQG